MRLNTALPGLALLGCLSACASSISYPSVATLRYETQVEYVEVGALVSASENVRVTLGPGRSYWFNAPDGSRWASDDPIVPASTKVIIWHQGVGLVTTASSMMTVRHVSGPRELKRGWYGRVIETRPGVQGIGEVTTEDGRRFTVTAAGRGNLPSLPFEVVVSEDGTRIFVLRTGTVLEVSPIV